MLNIKSHPLRESLSKELHARPFPVLDAPSQVVFLALTSNENDEKYIQSLAQQLGGRDYVLGSGHYYQDLGSYSLKWERHSEFVTYTILLDGEEETPFSDLALNHFPEIWLDSLTSQVITAVKLRVVAPASSKQVEHDILTNFHTAFQSESLAISYVLDKNAIVASDFKMDENGYIRFGVLPIGQLGRHRLGRIVQRLLEIETYRAMSMLTLPIAKKSFYPIN